jgi:hypothetical protein
MCIRDRIDALVRGEKLEPLKVGKADHSHKDPKDAEEKKKKVNPSSTTVPWAKLSGA